MTSNLGARFLDKRGQIGFSGMAETGIPQKIEDQVMGEVKRAFNPEFLNRLDEVILFTSLWTRICSRSWICWSIR